MANALEKILSGLLESDNESIQKATLELKEAFKDPSTLQTLCQVLGTSPQPQIRQYAAVLIRKKIHKSKQWASLDNGFKENIKGSILQLLIQEQDKSARAAIAQIIGVIARLETPSNTWPALFEFLVSFTKDEDPIKRELGMYVLSVVTSIAAEQLKPHMVSLLTLLSDTLNDGVNLEVCYLSIKAMTDLVFYIGDAEMKYLQNVVPRVLEVVQALASIDEDKACVALEFFDELLESEVAIIVPHLKPLVQYCLQIAKNKDYSDALRVKAMSFVSSLVRLKKKTVLKHHLVDPILQVLFPIICDEDEDEDDDEEDVEAHSPGQYAVQVVDTMALHLPAEKFLNKVTPLVEACWKSSEASHRRAAFLVIAVIVEGCGDFIMTRMLSQMLQTVCQGLNDPSHTVRNAALFAVGQFSEHLQPDISKYASVLLPILFQYLNKSMEEMEKNPKGLVKSHYALEMFCENLGLGILPYLPDLMNYLLNVVKNSHLHKPKELAISAIGAAASAAKEKMTPYFKDILELFKAYLTGEAVGEDVEAVKKLQLAVIDTLAVFARCIGAETFRPLATECVDLGFNLLQSSTDPDLNRCVYSLFAAISTVIKEDMGPYLEKIVNAIVASMRSTEGVKAHYKNETEVITVFNEDDLNEDEHLESDGEEENYQLEGISVENAYLDEKEDACCALGEIAFNTGRAFMPYLQHCFKEVLDLVEYPAVGIKKSVFVTLSQLCLCVHEVQKNTNSEEAATALKLMIVGVVPKFLEAIKTELDRTLVMTAVDALQEMLYKIGQPVLAITGATDAILTAMKEIFTHKVACQDQEEDEDESEAEFDSMLIESAGDVLPVMAKIMGGDKFLPFFTSFVQDLLKRLKVTSSTAEKSFAVGTLAEIIEACGPPVGSAFTNVLYPVFTRMTKDDDEEVRSNSVFALGVLAVNGGDAMISHYGDILKTLFSVMNAESNPRVMDNICAAVCRMVWHSQQNVPLGQALPVIMQLLPLKEDLEENVTVFGCLTRLYRDNIPEIIQFVPKILHYAVMAMRTENLKEDKLIGNVCQQIGDGHYIQAVIVQFVQSVRLQFPTDFDLVRSKLEDEELVRIMDTCLTLQVNLPQIS